MKLRASTILFTVSLVFLCSGTGISYVLLTNMHTVKVREITINTETGVSIHATLQVPKDASAGDPIPAVTVIHGLSQCKEWMYSLSLELARRNFVVLSIDAASHGKSGFASSEAKDRGGLAALSYLTSLSYVNGNIGIVGHSMGAEIAIQAIYGSTIEVGALVTIGGGWFEASDPWGNGTYPHNLLYTVGKYDELFNVPTLPATLKPLFGTDTLVKPGKLYGAFKDGTARKLVIGSSNHLFETIDPQILRATMNWMQNSLRGTTYTPSISDTSLIYHFHLVAGFMRVVGLALSIFPLSRYLLGSKYFQALQKSDAQAFILSTNDFKSLAPLYAMGGVTTMIPGFLFSALVPFPQIFGGFMFFWFLTSSIVFLLVLFTSYRTGFDAGIPWNTIGMDKMFSSRFYKQLLKSGLVALFIGLWLYTIVFIVDTVFHLDFRAFLPFVRVLTVRRAIIAPLYLTAFFPYFLVEGVWLFGILSQPVAAEPGRPTHALHWRGRGTWRTRMLLALAIKLTPFLAIVMIQVIGSMLMGKALLGGGLGFQLLFFYVLIPFFVVSIVLQAWEYNVTKRVYVGSWLNAFLFSWAISALLPFQF